jgi:hypothetical protein
MNQHGQQHPESGCTVPSLVPPACRDASEPDYVVDRKKQTVTEPAPAGLYSPPPSSLYSPPASVYTTPKGAAEIVTIIRIYLAFLEPGLAAIMLTKLNNKPDTSGRFLKES